MEYEIKIEPGSSIESVVMLLLEAKERGESAYAIFNGHRIDTKDLTIDSAYVEITGETKDKFDEKIKRQRAKSHEELAKDEKRAIASIPTWIERGETLVYPQKFEEWKEYVNYHAHELYGMLDLEHAIGIMEMLEEGESLTNIAEALDKQDHSGMSEAILRNILLHFSSRGPIFWEKTAYFKISEEDQKTLDTKRQENAEFEKEIQEKKKPRRSL